MQFVVARRRSWRGSRVASMPLAGSGESVLEASTAAASRLGAAVASAWRGTRATGGAGRSTLRSSCSGEPATGKQLHTYSILSSESLSHRPHRLAAQAPQSPSRRPRRPRPPPPPRHATELGDQNQFAACAPELLGHPNFTAVAAMDAPSSFTVMATGQIESAEVRSACRKRAIRRRGAAPRR